MCECECACVCVYLYIYSCTVIFALRCARSSLSWSCITRKQATSSRFLSPSLSPSLSLPLSLFICTGSNSGTERQRRTRIDKLWRLAAGTVCRCRCRCHQLAANSTRYLPLPLLHSLFLSLAPVPKIRAHFARGIWTRTQTRIRNRTRCGNEIPQADRKWQHEKIIKLELNAPTPSPPPLYLSRTAHLPSPLHAPFALIATICCYI